MMIALYGICFNILWIANLVKNIQLTNKIEDTLKENTLLKNRISKLEKEVRDEANKNIILESLLKQRSPKQNEEHKLY